MPSAATAGTSSASVTPSAIRPGRRAIAVPSRAAGPSARSFRQRFDGQNSAGPLTAASAGIKVMPASSITPTEIAIDGPSTRNCPNCARASVANAATTASAADAITGPTRPAAWAAAVRRSSPDRSRSRTRNSRKRK